MGRNFTPQAIAQLTRGAGEPLRGDAGLILLKGLLQSGVAYLGGYPGAPTSTLYDAIADAYQPVLNDWVSTSTTVPTTWAACWGRPSHCRHATLTMMGGLLKVTCASMRTAPSSRYLSARTDRAKFEPIVVVPGVDRVAILLW